MPRPAHPNWNGFTPMYDTLGKHITYAKCDSCNKVMKKSDSLALMNHKKVCKGPPNASEVSNSARVSTQRSPLSSLSTTTNDVNNKENPTGSLLDDNNAVAVTTSTTPKKINSQEHTSPAAKCPRLSVNDDNQSADTKNRNSKEKDVYFLKFLLCFNIDFKKINSAHCQNMLKTLDPTYTIPSIEDLTNRVLDYAIQKMNEEKIQDLTSTMGMATIGIDNEIIAISFAIHSNNKYFYIDNITICKDDVDYIKQLDVFCNLSVEMAKKVYNVSVKFVLYDGSVRISCMGIANNSKYYTITTFSQIISELKYNHDPFLVANSSDTEKVKQYDNVLESFEKKLTTANYTIADATEDLLYLVSNESLSINKSMDKTIIELLSPVSLAANYFMHEFKGHHFIDYKPLKDMMYEFLFDAVPNEAFDSLTEFKDQTGIFQELNNQQKFKFTRGRFLAHC